MSLGRKTCTVRAGGTNRTDDATAILEAFRTCGRGGKIVFNPVTYHVNTPMNVTWLDDVEIDLRGTLLVGGPLRTFAHSMVADKTCERSGEQISVSG